jgi:cytochrome c oxidase subunit 3
VSIDHHPAPAGQGIGITETVPSPFRPVGLSPWPLAIAVASMLTSGGAIAVWAHHGYWLLAVGLLSFLAVITLWGRDVFRDALKSTKAAIIVGNSFRYAMALFITTELFLFVAFFWGYFNFFFFPDKQGIGYAPVWPPNAIHTINPLGEPLFATLVMLLSSTTLTGAFDGVLTGNRTNAKVGTFATLILGLAFLGGQIYEYANLPFPLFHGGIYPSLFFILTAFDGLHVVVGVVLLALALARLNDGKFGPNSFAGFQTIAWYWTFVDVLWLFLFVTLYWVGASAVTVLW